MGQLAEQLCFYRHYNRRNNSYMRNVHRANERQDDESHRYCKVAVALSLGVPHCLSRYLALPRMEGEKLIAGASDLSNIINMNHQNHHEHVSHDTHGKVHA